MEKDEDRGIRRKANGVRGSPFPLRLMHVYHRDDVCSLTC